MARGDISILKQQGDNFLPLSYNRVMRKRRKFLGLLLATLIFFASTAFIILYTNPTVKTPPIVGLKLSFVILLFFSLFFFIFFLTTLLLRNATQGLLLALFFVSFLTLRLFHFTHVFFFILLTGLFIALQLLFLKNKD